MKSLEGVDYVVCPICSKKLKIINVKHLKERHGMTKEEAREFQKGINYISKNCSKKKSKAQEEKWSDSEYKEKVSKKISKVKKSNWTEEDSQRLAQYRRDYRNNNPEEFEKFKIRMSKSHKKKIRNDEDYRDDLLSRLKNKNTNSGWYESNCLGKIYLRSGFEFKVARYLDELSIDYSYEDLVILYKYKGEINNYVPDFSLENIILEVKPKNRIDEKVKCKKRSAIKEGYDFYFITEKELSSKDKFKKFIKSII